MHEGRVSLEDPNAGQQEFFVECTAGQTGIEVVVFLRDDQADVEAAQGGGVQGAQDIDGRYEVGGDGKNLFTGEDDGVEEAFNGNIFFGGGAAVDEAGGEFACGFGLREVGFS